MVFSTPFFLFLFLPAVLTAYLLVPARWRHPLLLLASLVFYVLGDRGYVLLLLLATAVTFVLGLGVEKGKPGSKGVLSLALIFNLGLLVFSKYGSFLLNARTLDVLHFRVGHLPLGISFFTFALISYVLDVRQGRVEAERNPFRFALYVSFFPKMVAGPIERYRDMADRLKSRPELDYARLSEGVVRFITGLAKKVLIANALAPVADEIFSLPAAGLTPAVAWLGALCYALQIYFDFSGYSDMAIGIGKMLGFEMKENFNYPYLSRSVREFWQRWHISLSGWFRDYLFLPLAYAISRRIPTDRLFGARAEMWAYSCGILITMVLCGLWHGASWTFGFWGLWHGIFLVLENTRTGKRWHKRSPAPLQFLLAQGAVLFGWVIFRSTGMGQIAFFSKAMLGFGGGGRGVLDLVRVSDYLGRNLVVVLLAGVALSCPVPRVLARWRARKLAGLPPGSARTADSVMSWSVTALCVALLGLCAIALAGGTYNPFVYRQF